MKQLGWKTNLENSKRHASAKFIAIHEASSRTFIALESYASVAKRKARAVLFGCRKVADEFASKCGSALGGGLVDRKSSRRPTWPTCFKSRDKHWEAVASGSRYYSANLNSNDIV